MIANVKEINNNNKETQIEKQNLFQISTRQIFVPLRN